MYFSFNIIFIIFINILVKQLIKVLYYLKISLFSVINNLFFILIRIIIYYFKMKPYKYC